MDYLVEYIEGWRRRIWNKGFEPYFKEVNYFKKGDSFMKYNGANLVVQRFLFQYIHTP